MRKIQNYLLFSAGILLAAYLLARQFSNFRENASNNLGRLSGRGWIVETDQMHIVIDKDYGFIRSAKLRDSDFEFAPSGEEKYRTRHRPVFTEFVLENEDGTFRNYVPVWQKQEHKKSEPHITVTCEKNSAYLCIIKVETECYDADGTPLWKDTLWYKFAKNLPYFILCVDRHVLKTNVYSNFQLCHMWSWEFDYSVMTDYTGNVVENWGHWPVEDGGGKNVPQPHLLQSSTNAAFTAIDHGRMAMFPFYALYDAALDVCVGEIATYVTPNTRATFALMAAAAVNFQKQSPTKSDWEQQWNWFGQRDPSSLQLEAGMRFGGEFVIVIARGRETVKKISEALFDQNHYIERNARNYFSSSWGSRTQLNGRGLFYLKAYSNYIDTQNAENLTAWQPLPFSQTASLPLVDFGVYRHIKPKDVVFREEFEDNKSSFTGITTDKEGEWRQVKGVAHSGNACLQGSSQHDVGTAVVRKELADEMGNFTLDLWLKDTSSSSHVYWQIGLVSHTGKSELRLIGTNAGIYGEKHARSMRPVRITLPNISQTWLDTTWNRITFVAENGFGEIYINSKRIAKTQIDKLKAIQLTTGTTEDGENSQIFVDDVVLYNKMVDPRADGVNLMHKYMRPARWHTSGEDNGRRWKRGWNQWVIDSLSSGISYRLSEDSDRMQVNGWMQSPANHFNGKAFAQFNFLNVDRSIVHDSTAFDLQWDDDILGTCGMMIYDLKGLQFAELVQGRYLRFKLAEPNSLMPEQKSAFSFMCHPHQGEIQKRWNERAALPALTLREHFRSMRAVMTGNNSGLALGYYVIPQADTLGGESAWSQNLWIWNAAQSDDAAKLTLQTYAACPGNYTLMLSALAPIQGIQKDGKTLASGWTFDNKSSTITINAFWEDTEQVEILFKGRRDVAHSSGG